MNEPSFVRDPRVFLNLRKADQKPRQPYRIGKGILILLKIALKKCSEMSHEIIFPEKRQSKENRLHYSSGTENELSPSLGFHRILLKY